MKLFQKNHTFQNKLKGEHMHSQIVVFKEMEKYIFKNSGASLMVQWLRLCAPYAGDLGLFPGQGPRSHMLQLKKKKEKRSCMKIFWGRMDTCIFMAESLHCLPETVTALLIGYTPIQNKKFKRFSFKLL